MITVGVHQKCEHLGLESYDLGLGLGLATAGLDYIPGYKTIFISIAFTGLDPDAHKPLYSKLHGNHSFSNAF